RTGTSPGASPRACIGPGQRLLPRDHVAPRSLPAPPRWRRSSFYERTVSQPSPFEPVLDIAVEESAVGFRLDQPFKQQIGNAEVLVTSARPELYFKSSGSRAIPCGPNIGRPDRHHQHL